MITWNNSILAEITIPKKLDFTARELSIIYDIIQERKDTSDNTRLFAKLVTLGYVAEVKVKRGYQYHLTEEAEETLQAMTQKSKLEIMAQNACSRCNGKGYIAEYSMIQGGVCFECNGTGKAK